MCGQGGKNSGPLKYLKIATFNESLLPQYFDWNFDYKTACFIVQSIIRSLTVQVLTQSSKKSKSIKMAVKFIALFALLAAASAAPQHYEHYQQQPAVIKSYQPVVQHVKHVEHEEPANYDFEYAVHDDHTGDIKEHHESAKDGAISGFYSLIDADGYKRIVHYTADDHHGFNAQVQREPVQGHVVKAAQPVQKYIAQPAIAVQKYVAPAPQYYAAPAQVKVVAQPAIAVQKYYAAPAPQYYSAPAPQYYSAPAQVKVVAPVSKVASTGEAYTHVSYKGPSASYNY